MSGKQKLALPNVMKWEDCEVGEECKCGAFDAEFIKKEMWTELIVEQEEIEGKIRMGRLLTHMSQSFCDVGIYFNEYVETCDFE